MHCLISGLAKSGTTILFSQVAGGMQPAPQTFFEPDTDEALAGILATPANTLTKVLVGRVSANNALIKGFDRHILINRDPRDQFISMLLYLFYDFQVNGDRQGFLRARAALQRKVDAPASVSTIELYSELAAIVGRGPIEVFRRLHQVMKEYVEAFRPFMLSYESLVDGQLPDSLTEYLGFSLDSGASVPAIYERVARSRGYGAWHYWLNDADLAYVNNAWGETIAELGYTVNDAPGDLVIDARTSLDYVDQFEPHEA